MQCGQWLEAIKQAARPARRRGNRCQLLTTGGRQHIGKPTAIRVAHGVHAFCVNVVLGAQARQHGIKKRYVPVVLRPRLLLPTGGLAFRVVLAWAGQALWVDHQRLRPQGVKVVLGRHGAGITRVAVKSKH